ncbi:site-2 protease family protein [Candidatus Collierbacteria bacterium]|nr:site-2 protease family protein [Candidatus Collierbacteria bacterium]
MIDTLISSPLSFLISLLAIAAAITIHEFAHAWAADRLGDPTPRLQGRLTLNPLAHLDPIGTLMLILFRFGWGKPVQFDQFNLRNPRRDAMLISIAGPASNLLTATLAAVLLRFLPSNLLGLLILQPFIVISIVLAVFNFVPVHPLDGGKILSGILPLSLAREWEQIQAQFGTILLIMMVLPWGGTAPIFYLTGPVIQFILNILLGFRPAA